jgi:hypothetical protein
MDVIVQLGACVLGPGVFDAMGFARIDPDGKVDVASVEDLMQWRVKMGYLSGPVDVATVADFSYAEAAVAKLGAYR